MIQVSLCAVLQTALIVRLHILTPLLILGKTQEGQMSRGGGKNSCAEESFE